MVGASSTACALDHSLYSRRAQKKSTAEANYFYFNSSFISFPGAASPETALLFLSRPAKHGHPESASPTGS
jgi:hypothetical protein